MCGSVLAVFPGPAQHSSLTVLSVARENLEVMLASLSLNNSYSVCISLVCVQRLVVVK